MRPSDRSRTGDGHYLVESHGHSQVLQLVSDLLCPLGSSSLENLEHIGQPSGRKIEAISEDMDIEFIFHNAELYPSEYLDP